MIEQEGIKIEIKEVDTESRIRLLQISGYVDQANCHLLQKTIDDCLADEYYCLTFNLQNLVYMSSAGWGVLIGEIKRFRESGGDIKLANMGPEIYEIYQMLEFYHIISEYPSVDEAIASFDSVSGSTKVEVEKVVKEANDTPPPAAPVAPKPEPTPDPAPVEPPVEDVREIEMTVESSDIEELLGNTPSNNNANNTPQEQDIVYEQDVTINLDSILSEESISPPAEQEPSRQPEKVDGAGYVEFKPRNYDRKQDISMMPLPDKVRAIVAKAPHLNTRQIRKLLSEPEYGETQIGYFKLRALLKSLDLNSKEKRFRFYRSA